MVGTGTAGIRTMGAGAAETLSAVASSAEEACSVLNWSSFLRLSASSHVHAYCSSFCHMTEVKVPQFNPGVVSYDQFTAYSCMYIVLI